MAEANQTVLKVLNDLKAKIGTRGESIVGRTVTETSGESTQTVGLNREEKFQMEMLGRGIPQL
jgi:hypothetical protein